ncbi:transmembrane protein, putative (macronuclear) [Tetrahymena thermophila SB210]|uniref:Transmembrane protein, putative n=1 Tax=Tetrahymena thermophila (strain SB210) TaxID=312017 RepID=I7MFI7_TETTS|nr:transmembrane protein, putative [Tetrahymena thermophila SB210]EAR99917.1 transmembrane protein, putative [Tetrahymena thermophila SB210]|eukprot:XP_001020162.1 transmembrane protein, putative [Tetrahymena thermophila SB210]
MSQYFRNADMFGAEVKIYFQKLQYHGTCWGVLFTTVMYLVITFATVYYGEDLVYRKSPQTTYSQENVVHPERYYLTPKTFTAAFGIEDSVTWNQIVDPTIYTVTALNRKRFKKYNTTSQQYYFEEHVLDLQPRICDQSQFQVPNTQSYFESLAGVQNMYCFSFSNTTDSSPDQEDLNSLYIEGDYTADAFAQIEIGFYGCKNKTLIEIQQLQSQGLPVITCKPQSEIDLHLQNAYIGMYLTTQNFDPNNFESPFSNAATDLFWPVSNSLSKYLTVSYKNTYINSNQGLLFDDVVIEKGFQLASDKEQLILPVDNQFAYLNIRFQKGLQDRIFRTYKSIGAVIAQIGGIATFMRILGFIVAFPISKLQLRKNIINELFSFSENANASNKQQNPMKLYQECYQISKKNESQAYPNSQTYLKKKTSGTFIQQNSKYQFVETVQAADDQQQKNIQQPDQNNVSRNKFKLEELQKTNQKYISENLNLEQNKKEIQLENFCQQLVENQIQNDKTALNQYKQIDTPATSDNQKSLINKKYKSSNNHRQSQNNQSAEILNQKIDDNIKNSYYNKSNSGKDNHENYDQLFNHDKKKQMDLSFSDSVLYYLFPCPKRIKVKKNKIDFCNQIISEQFDGVYILKKLLELEKLKAILLSEEQLKLFEYIPKPVIDDQSVADYASLKFQKSQKQFLNSNNLEDTKGAKDISKNVSPSQTIQNNLSSQIQFNQNTFNILRIQPKTDQEKSLEALQALKKIFQKDNLSKKDVKILQMIDPKFQQPNKIFNSSNNNSDYEDKKCDFSPIAAITNQRINNQNELINLNEIKNSADGIQNSVISNNITNQINNFKINKFNQVQKSIGIVQYPDESVFPLEINSQQNSYSVNNNDQYSEQIQENFLQNNKIDASAAKLYTMNFLLPFQRFSTLSPTKKQNSLVQIKENSSSN